MSERIPIHPGSSAEHFAIAALVSRKELSPNVGRGFLEVEFKVDGVEVPFAKTIEDIYQRFHEDVNKRAAEIAYKNAHLEGLDSLREAIYQASCQIREKIEQVFGVKLEEP